MRVGAGDRIDIEDKTSNAAVKEELKVCKQLPLPTAAVSLVRRLHLPQSYETSRNLLSRRLVAMNVRN